MVEIFGPTIQGEGADQGVPCLFARFGGCDFKCDWCDTPYAVLPQSVRQAERLTPLEIVERLETLNGGTFVTEWVILSGGNPCLHDLGPLVTMLHLWKHKVSVETQGTVWKQWLNKCNRVAVSPKPPSSGMETDLDKSQDFIWNLDPQIVFLKVVIFDHNDYLFARELHNKVPGIPFFLSAGNDAGPTVGNPSRTDERTNQQVALDLIAKYRWLVNRVLVDPMMDDVQVQCQQHVLLWGNQRGR